MRPLLLDTCAAIWIGQGAPLEASADEALRAHQKAGSDVLISPISAWELGILVSRGRLRLGLPPLRFFDDLIEQGVQLADLTPAILVDSSTLPDCSLRDPADRILAATARANGYQLMTRDRPLLAYGEAGWMQTLPC